MRDNYRKPVDSIAKNTRIDKVVVWLIDVFFSLIFPPCILLFAHGFFSQCSTENRRVVCFLIVDEGRRLAVKRCWSPFFEIALLNIFSNSLRFISAVWWWKVVPILKTEIWSIWSKHGTVIETTFVIILTFEEACAVPNRSTRSLIVDLRTYSSSIIVDTQLNWSFLVEWFETTIG